MDIATLIGVFGAFAAILGGQHMEGGNIRSILQPTAAIIVLGGTFGSTFVSYPLEVVIKAFKDALRVFMPPKVDMEQTIKDIVGYATKARKNGLISLEQEGQKAKDPFTQKGIALVVDGTDPQQFRDTMEVELATFEAHAKTSAEYFEAAGGYAPTIGIIGAVLGLIHVMENLSDSSKLGEGIAVAFVATIYGLVTANIFCLPMATKLKHQIHEEVRQKELILEGLFAIQNGENPRFIEDKLRAFVAGGEKPGKGGK